MWCPSATLSVWANAWLAGRAAPDDVLDALSRWAPTQSVNVYDSVGAGGDGLSSADGDDGGGIALLQALRASPRARDRLVRGVFPVPGDVRGLPAGTRFEHDALLVGEAVIVAEADGSSAVGLIPDVVDTGDADDPLGAVSWTVYRLPDVGIGDHHDLGDAEYAMRSAVRSAADTLGDTGLCRVGVDANPRLRVEQLMESSRAHRIPDHAPVRAVQVLENANRVDAIITVCRGLGGDTGRSVADLRQAETVLRPLAATVRSARTAAIDAILRSAWRG